MPSGQSRLHMSAAAVNVGPGGSSWGAGVSRRLILSSPQETRDGASGAGPRDQQRRGQSAVAEPTPVQRFGGDLAAGADGAAVGAGHGSGRDRGGDVHQR